MESVRLDKYLWAIRVYKTRTDATDACKGGKVRINGLDVKPSKEVKVGDVLTIRKGAVTYTYKALELIDKRQGVKLVPQYAENLPLLCKHELPYLVVQLHNLHRLYEYGFSCCRLIVYESRQLALVGGTYSCATACYFRRGITAWL